MTSMLPSTCEDHMSSLRHEFTITYIGGPTVVLSIDGLKLITDPTFDPPGRDYSSGTVSLR